MLHDYGPPVRSKTITIFEGADGCGKSTAARKYGMLTNARYVHFGNEPSIDIRYLAKLYMDAMMPALLGYQDVVLDRCWLSETPYANAYRRGKHRLDPADYRMLERVALRCGAVVVWCQPPIDVMLENFGADGREEYLPSKEKLLEVQQSYMAATTQLPSITYDYTATSFTRGLCTVLESLRYPRHLAYVASAGSLRPSIVLVGDSFANHNNFDSIYQYPLVSFKKTGCSYWLAKLLEDADIPEARLFWVNADQDLRVIPPCQHIFALGELASKHLTYLGISHQLVNHPQHHKRFCSSDPYRLIEMIQQVLSREAL